MSYLIWIYTVKNCKVLQEQQYINAKHEISKTNKTVKLVITENVLCLSINFHPVSQSQHRLLFS